MIALSAGAFGRGAVCKKLPRYHAFANVNTTVIHNAGLHNFISIGPEYCRYTPSQKIISEVAKVQRFIGVGRGVLHHYFTSCCSMRSVLIIIILLDKKAYPEFSGYAE